MNKVRWGIIGTGGIATKFANAVKNSDGAELVAVASRTLEKANEFADVHKIENRFGSYAELAEFDGIDAVYIGVPHIHHAPCTKLCLNEGKAVLCEKPIATTAKEFAEVKKLAEEKGVFLMEALWSRFVPAMKEIRRLVENGVIGEVREVSGDFCYNIENKTGSRMFKNEEAGGALLDVGIYGLNFAAMFLGTDIKEIKTAIYTNNGVDERTNILLTYNDSNAIAHVSSATTLNKPHIGFIYGSKGRICVPGFCGAQKFDVVENTPDTDYLDVVKSYEVPYKGNGFEEEIEECNRCIMAGKTQSDIMPLSESEKILKIMDAVRAQAGIVYKED